ncbi:hypothetical protein OH77DRAFT_1526045 [Trametes cingulata]|nr:hypothetical protein OH77DRAFT_1526045 [Trametes cingulata]
MLTTGVAIHGSFSPIFGPALPSGVQLLASQRSFVVAHSRRTPGLAGPVSSRNQCQSTSTRLRPRLNYGHKPSALLKTPISISADGSRLSEPVTAHRASGTESDGHGQQVYPSPNRPNRKLAFTGPGAFSSSRAGISRPFCINALYSLSTPPAQPRLHLI